MDIKNKLKDYNVDIVKDRAKMTIKFNDNDLDKIENIISKIFGIHSYTVAEICSDNLDDIKNTILKVEGRHDPCIVQRALPVIEAVTAIAMVELIS